MKRTIIPIILSFAAGMAVANVPVVAVDNTDNSPIIGATVIDKSGIILGITDGNGTISVNSEQAFPITIRCMGYEPTTSGVKDTVGLAPSTYQLDEFVITPHDRPIKRVLCFAREYSSGIAGQDTMQYYCEYMAEAFIADGKVKGYKDVDSKPTAKAFRRYARIVKEGSDSIFIPKYDDDITEISWFDFMAFIPSEKLELPDALKKGQEADTVHGKYGPQFIFKKKNGLLTKTADVLSNHKNRVWSPFIFKLIGMTVDIDHGTWTLTFADNGSHAVGIHELICGTYNLHLIGRGRWIKKVFETTEPIELSSYLELYPVAITNCTVAEYKEMKDDFNRQPFQYPAKLQPLSPAIQDLINKIDSKYPARK